MKPEWKQKWIAALRSGKYSQAREALRTPQGFCCLGVLCDVVDPAQWVPGIQSVVGMNSRSAYGYRRSGEESGLEDYGWLNYQILELTGLKQEESMDLADMNDKGASFEQIADRIEAKL